MYRLALVLPLIAIAACGKESDVKMENASVADVAKEMRKQDRDNSFVEPGKWRQTMTLLEMDAPGMPPEARQMMQRAMDQAQVHEVCLTPEQAKRPKEDFFSGADKNCRYEHFSWGDGKIDLKLNCQHPNASQTMAMVGSYSPDAYTMTMTATNVGGGPAGGMTMKMKVDARRIGDCDSKDQVQVGN